MCTHFFAGFVVAPEALWLLWVRAHPRGVGGGRAWSRRSQAAMLPFALADTTHGTGWIAKVPPLNRLGTGLLEWGVSLLYRRGHRPTRVCSRQGC